MKTAIALVILAFCGAAHAKGHQRYMRGAMVRAIQENLGAGDGAMMPRFLQDGIMGPQTAFAIVVEQAAAKRAAGQAR